MTGSPRQCPSIPPHHASLPPALKVMRVEGRQREGWKAGEGEVGVLVVWLGSWEGCVKTNLGGMSEVLGVIGWDEMVNEMEVVLVMRWVGMWCDGWMKKGCDGIGTECCLFSVEGGINDVMLK